MRYISVSDKRSRTKAYNLTLTYVRVSIFICAILCVLYRGYACAETLDRVVAYVDDTAITLSEFRDNYNKMKNTLSSISETEVLNSMINQVLLAKEAGKMHLIAASREELIKDFLDIKIKAAIIIKDSEMERFYQDNKDKFGDKAFTSVRDDIEKYLFEKQTNERLKSYLSKLRADAEIKINLTLEKNE